VSLRVIAGTARGRKLKTVPGKSTRPITDRVKEALFNILASEIVGSSWWDLFAGTGAVGIEALSRGSAFVRFSDLKRTPIETIKRNLEHCGFVSGYEVTKGDAYSLLASHPDRKFDFIYIAPPQYQAMWSKTLTLIDDYPQWLAADGMAIVQIAPKEYQPFPFHHLEEFDQRRYGSTLLVFFQLNDEYHLKSGQV
jgi:16S rRNA (guanine(966)-N(2))-methyltransferase RsmD